MSATFVIFFKSNLFIVIKYDLKFGDLTKEQKIEVNEILSYQNFETQKSYIEANVLGKFISKSFQYSRLTSEL